MGIRILKTYVPEISQGFFEKADYDIGGKYKAEKIMFSDNYLIGDKNNRIIVFPYATQKIFDYIGWGIRDGKNHNEMGGFLLGRYFKDTVQKLMITIVEDAVPAVHAIGTAGTLNIPPEDLLQAHEKLEVWNREKENEKKLQLVGWFHTHPNSLDVFMSGTDQYTQSQLFREENAIAIVMNPHRKIWKCFRAEHCFDTKAEFLISKEMIESYGTERLFNNFWGLGYGN